MFRCLENYFVTSIPEVTPYEFIYGDMLLNLRLWGSALHCLGYLTHFDVLLNFVTTQNDRDMKHRSTGDIIRGIILAYATMVMALNAKMWLEQIRSGVDYQIPESGNFLRTVFWHNRTCHHAYSKVGINCEMILYHFVKL